MDRTERMQMFLKELDDQNLESLQDDLELILNAYGDIVQSIYDSLPKLDVGEVYMETLIIKLIFASVSLLKLSEGTQISTLKYPKKNEIIDRSSIYILARSIIETFLTLEYLYFNAKSKEEQIFRYNLWRVSGFTSRQSLFKTVPKEFEEKLLAEREEISVLKKQIKQSHFYSSLKKNDLWKLDKYGLPRTISWADLINQSVLHTDYISKAYSLYSSYAHSEFLSAMQINESRMGKFDEFNVSTIFNNLNIIRLINCVSILLLTEKFDCAKSAYFELDDNLKFTIEFWSRFGRNA